MIKGLNKQMVVLKLDGNRIYESACFVVRSDLEKKRDEEKDMLREANRILEEMELGRSKKKRGGGKRFLLWMLTLIVGAAIGFALSFLL